MALAPIGSLESFHPDAGAAVARAAGAFGVPFCLSSVTQPGLEAAAAASAGPRVYQLYVRGDRAWVDEQVNRAIAAGYDAFCLTVDTAQYAVANATSPTASTSPGVAIRRGWRSRRR